MFSKKYLHITDSPINFILDCEGNDCNSAYEDESGGDENLIEDDIVLLNESDIPGASLDGKDPSELNVVQLKRWLVCRGAPVTGKKPELIQRYAHSLIVTKLPGFVITSSMAGMYF